LNFTKAGGGVAGGAGSAGASGGVSGAVGGSYVGWVFVIKYVTALSSFPYQLYSVILFHACLFFGTTSIHILFIPTVSPVP